MMPTPVVDIESQSPAGAVNEGVSGEGRPSEKTKHARQGSNSKDVDQKARSQVAPESPLRATRISKASVKAGLKQEWRFLLALGVLFAVGAVVTPYPDIARWFGFAIAGYSAIANDSIQTLGTFIASNTSVPWYVLWVYVAGILTVTVLISFVTEDGDVSYGRLMSKGYDEAPAEFEYLQVVCPVLLLLLTRFKMPVSTTFLLLSAFASKADAIGAVIEKSLMGYVLAFFLALGIWGGKGAWMHEKIAAGPPERYWRPIQWLTSGALWSFWLMQDAANIAVYLPRKLAVAEFLVFTGILVALLAVLFRQGGEKIQQIVDSKTETSDLRGASSVSFLFAIILFFFKELSSMPMSTTWVFIGILSGRELAISLNGVGKPGPETLTEVRYDLGKTVQGFVVSLLIAAVTNPVIRDTFVASLGA